MSRKQYSKEVKIELVKKHLEDGMFGGIYSFTGI